MTDDVTTGASGERPPRVAPLGRGWELGVVPADPDAPLPAPLFAVNLLDLRSALAYRLYGLLVAPLLRRLGGRVLFKGRRRRRWPPGASGFPDLMVVSYPDAAAFLELATHRGFQAASLLRRVALTDFRFGFLERLAPAPERVRGRRRSSWLAAGVRGAVEPAALDELGREAAPRGVEVFFTGRRAADLAVRRGPAAPWRATPLAPPLPLDHLVLLRARREAALVELLDHPAAAWLGRDAGASVGGWFRWSR